MEFPRGYLEEHKVINIFTFAFPQRMPDALYRKMIVKYDGNNIGKVDFPNFMIAVSEICRQDPEKLDLLYLTSCMFDVRGKGTISVDDIKIIIRVSVLLADNCIA